MVLHNNLEYRNLCEIIKLIKPKQDLFLDPMLKLGEDLDLDYIDIRDCVDLFETQTNIILKKTVSESQYLYELYNNILYSSNKSNLNENTYVGAVKAYFRHVLPHNFLECDGKIYDKETYPLLYWFMKHEYGISGKEEFRVPREYYNDNRLDSITSTRVVYGIRIDGYFLPVLNRPL